MSTTAAAVPAPSSDVAKPSRLSDEMLGKIQTHEDALRMLQEMGTVVEDFGDYGSGFDGPIDKLSLINVPFFIAEWRFQKSDKIQEGGEFVVVLAVTQDDKKVLFIDGGTGIFEQLRHVTATREENGILDPESRRGLICRKGLRSSNYETQDAAGKTIKATTFYISN